MVRQRMLCVRQSVFVKIVLNERRDSAIRATVEAFQEVGLSFVDVVEKIAAKFSLSKERAESEVSEYWNE